MTVSAANLTQMRALIARLQRDGVRVALQAGWETRDAGGVFGPWVGGLLHHDASTTRSGTWGSLGVIIAGRGGVNPVPGPLAQGQAARGDVPQIAVVSAGRANHGGAGGPLRTPSGKVIPADSMNRWGVGLEVANDGVGETYSDATLYAVETWGYHVNELADEPPSAIWGHKEWAPTRKIDPVYPMAWMRARIAAYVGERGLFMALTEAEENEILTAARNINGAVGVGQRNFATTVEATLSAIQGLHNVVRAGDSAIAAKIGTAEQAVLTGLATLPPPERLTDDELRRLGQVAGAEAARLGLRIDPDDILDALRLRVVSRLEAPLPPGQG